MGCGCMSLFDSSPSERPDYHLWCEEPDEDDDFFVFACEKCGMKINIRNQPMPRYGCPGKLPEPQMSSDM